MGHRADAKDSGGVGEVVVFGVLQHILEDLVIPKLTGTVEK